MTVNRIKILTISVLALMFLFSGCNQKAKEEDKDEQVKQELKDVGEEVDELVKAERDKLENDLNNAIADFDQKIEKLNQQIENQKVKISQEQEDALAELKTKRDELQGRLDEAKVQSKEEWNEFKSEFEKDFDNFKTSVKDFFVDNE